jgi:photosystem II stability/assembly factor-like uncharacterized protein
LDFNNPLILYAAMWDHQRKPWTMISGGPGSGLYKSSDGGSSWEKLTKGLPDAFGKAGISVSRADGDVVYAVIEAEGTKAGVYRSADAGASWTQVSKDRVNVARSWYYMEIFADPQEVNTVYCLNAPVMKSTDGGRTWNNVPTPHGDNHHLWINPTDNRKMINSNDGGANISNNGGRNWSTQQNQATAQFTGSSRITWCPTMSTAGSKTNSAIRISSRTKRRWY